MRTGPARTTRRRGSLAPARLLGLVACAMLCGVIRWARGQGAGVLAALEVPDGSPDKPPVATTLTRALARVDADVLDAAVGHFLQAHNHQPTGRDHRRLAAAPGRRGRQDGARRPRRARPATTPARRSTTQRRPGVSANLQPSYEADQDAVTWAETLSL